MSDNKLQKWNISKFMSVCTSLIVSERNNLPAEEWVFLERTFLKSTHKFCNQ